MCDRESGWVKPGGSPGPGECWTSSHLEFSFPLPLSPPPQPVSPSPRQRGSHLPESAPESRAPTASLARGEALDSRQCPASSSTVASEIASFMLQIYLNQPFTSDGFKNMLEVSILNTRNTNNKQMRLRFPSSVPAPPSFLPPPPLRPPRAVFIHGAHFPPPHPSPSLNGMEVCSLSGVWAPLGSGFPPQLIGDKGDHPTGMRGALTPSSIPAWPGGHRHWPLRANAVPG